MKRLFLLSAVALSCLVVLGEARGRGRSRGKSVEETGLEEDQKTQKEREGKVFSLFSIVTFDNEPCASKSKTGSGSTRNGTCFTSNECRTKGGTQSGNCAAGFGVCCVFTVENSGDAITQNCSYIRNPGFPAAYTGTETSFSNTINKCSCDVCFIRLDFEAFTLLGPADSGETNGGACQDTFTVSSSTGQAVPVICGINNGKHMYIEAGNGCSDSVTVSTDFHATATGTRRWDIKATQITCHNTLAPPAGCLEYLTSAIGTITSFNWESSGETHLASQDHKICVRHTKNSCCIQYTKCNDPLAWTLSGNLAVDAAMALTNSECTLDYIEAQSFTPDCFRNGPSAGISKICGGILNTQTMQMKDLEAVCDCGTEFSLTIHTDAMTETPDTMTLNTVMNKGVCFNYNLVNCK